MKFKYKVINNDLAFGNNILYDILKTRGINNINEFLNVGEHNIEDHNLYDNMNMGVKCLDKHLKKGSKICIVIDMDYDGFSSGAEEYLYLQNLKEKFNFDFTVEYITHSKKAHGLTNEIMLKLEKGNYDLVIIPDASSNEYKQHKILKDNGIDVICLDHHNCDKYSDYAIVINNQLSKKITNKSMTGVGVVYKFNKALDKFYNVSFADNYLDLVATGMIADHSDLRDLESRYLVLKGLNLIQNKENKNKFITKIFEKKAYSMNNKVTITNVGFYMCPLVNCIIRGGDYETKINLFKAFIGVNETIIDKIKGKGEVELSFEDYMIRKYDKLKKIQDETSNEAVTLLSKQIEDYELYKQEIMVVNGSDIKDNTYNRIIVNNLCDKYKKHCLLLKNYNGLLMGSSAGMKNKEITDLRLWCKNTNLFEKCEGHNMAFGAKIKINNINKLYGVISKIKSEDILTYNVDYLFTDKTINNKYITEILKYSHIWGNEVDEPLFAFEDIIINTFDINISNQTLKFKYRNLEFVFYKLEDEKIKSLIKNKQNKFTIIGRVTADGCKKIKIPQIVVENFDFIESNINLNPFLQ